MARDLSVFEQRGYEVRLGWGPHGLRSLAPNVDAVVIVDVLSFSTSVDIALGRGVIVFPYRWHNGTEHDFAAAVDAQVADPTGEDLGLRPASLVAAPAGLRLVMPSPNGSALTFGAREAGANRVIVGCLRNAEAVARSLDGADSIGVIAAGERWNGTTGPLRPAIEDLLGAGRIIRALGRRSVSPEARVASTAADINDGELRGMLRECGSGREKRSRNRAEDIDLAAACDVSDQVPTLIDQELRSAAET
ncbi:MAG: 2-phosphosulfolactate phosphatase [Actinomycetota bacterium]